MSQFRKKNTDEKKKVTLLTNTFFQQEDTLAISQELIGKLLVTNIAGKLTSAVITETEAYKGFNDRASHAFGKRITKRNKPLYNQGGSLYIYLCYGIHNLLNIVTNKKDIPHSVFIRSAYPVQGVDVMRIRRPLKNSLKTICKGPANLTKALGISKNHTGMNLKKGFIWIEDIGINIEKNAIEKSARIGIDYAGSCAKLPYRFNLLNPSQILSFDFIKKNAHDFVY